MRCNQSWHVLPLAVWTWWKNVLERWQLKTLVHERLEHMELIDGNLDMHDSSLHQQRAKRKCNAFKPKRSASTRFLTVTCRKGARIKFPDRETDKNMETAILSSSILLYWHHVLHPLEIRKVAVEYLKCSKFTNDGVQVLYFGRKSVKQGPIHLKWTVEQMCCFLVVYRFVVHWMILMVIFFRVILFILHYILNTLKFSR